MNGYPAWPASMDKMWFELPVQSYTTFTQILTNKSSLIGFQRSHKKTLGTPMKH